MDEETEKIMFRSAMIAMVAGLIVVGYLIWLSYQESYSALYIYPGSYSNYVNLSELPKEVSFVYGIKSYEREDKVYHVKIYLGDSLVKSKEVFLRSGETFEEREYVTVPKSVKLPIKVKVVAEVDGVTYEVHFWLKAIS